MDIVEEIKTNRESGARRLEREYRARLLAHAQKVCGDASLAEDFVNETFCVALERIDTLSDSEAFFGWLCGILVNCHSRATRRKEHERVRTEYETEKARYDAAMEELSDEQARLTAVMEETDALLVKLAEEIETNTEEYEAALAAVQTAEDAIDTKIAQLYAAYLASLGVNAGSGNLSLGTGSDGQTYITYSGASGTLMWPVPGCYSVSSEYGTRTHPITGEVSRMHYGMDIDGYGHDGGSIVACDGGVVTTVGYNSGYGNYIIVDHGNGMQTLYAHMSGTAVAEGTTVGQGETIGYLGATGLATGTHCHVEVFVDGQNVDPSAYLGGGY